MRATLSHHEGETALSPVTVHRPREAHNALTGQHLLLPGGRPQVPRRTNVPMSHIREHLCP